MNDELMRRAGMEDLSNIVRVRLTLAGHCSYHQTGQQMWLCNGYLTEAKDLATNIPGRFTGDAIESAGVMFAEWLVIGVGGKSRRPMMQQEWEDLSLSLVSKFWDAQRTVLVYNSLERIVVAL